MARKTKDSGCCQPADHLFGGCRVEALVTVDERGQMVLPKDLREKAGIKPGDKLAIASMEKDGRVCCISLIKAEEFSKMVKDIIGPVMKELM